jgi:uncharacterized membrane protein YeaQ/YmgE (transglycosylase-associated protein family)
MFGSGCGKIRMVVIESAKAWAKPGRRRLILGAGQTREKGATRMLGSLIWLLVIGALAGWLAGLIMKGSGFGLLGDIVIGVVGSLLGGFLFNLVGLAAYGLIAQLLMAVVGAVVLLFIVKLIRRA